MGVYIKGMEMPETCFECPFMFSRRYCCADLTLDFYGDDGEYTELKGRVDGCPLVPVPPHGSLIDADALIEDIRKHSESYFADDFAREWVSRAPTIIEAEG